jgi:peptidyl-prolyl cis-trans isomerase B (cyclophilin B)
MRRPLVTTLLCSCVLALAACGDDEETAGGGGDAATTATTATQTQAAEPTASGCERAKKPKAKKVGRQKRPSLKIDREKSYTAVVETNCGTVEIALDVKRAPKTVASFVAMTRKGFFDGLGFHRIVPGFVVQGGDPAGNGSGGPGYDVVETPPEDLTYTKGVVAMAKTEMDAPGTSGSQFFIVTADDAGLPADYALLGKVSKGQDVVGKIEGVPAGPDGQPEEPVVMSKVTIKTK